MTIDELAPSLRSTDRKRLLAFLTELGSPNPSRRARAALDATELLNQKGLSWKSLLPPEHENRGATGARADWRELLKALLPHPDLTREERIFVHKIADWRAPGQEGLARLRAIAERLGVATSSVPRPATRETSATMSPNPGWAVAPEQQG